MRMIVLILISCCPIAMRLHNLEMVDSNSVDFIVFSDDRSSQAMVESVVATRSSFQMAINAAKYVKLIRCLDSKEYTCKRPYGSRSYSGTSFG
ncbi:hypothetical protein HAX54_026135, partial [Datura stramonium]|nr:hypothetical protein [Datura stramonium]